MASAAVLLLPLALAAAQATGEPPFRIQLPGGYSAIAPVAGEIDSWESRSQDSRARLLVQRFQLESAGARAELVARQLRQQAWTPAALGAQELTITPWSGDWGGVPDCAGHLVRYRLADQSMVAVERVAVLRDHLVHLLWDGPAAWKPTGLLRSCRLRQPWGRAAREHGRVGSRPDWLL